MAPKVQSGQVMIIGMGPVIHVGQIIKIKILQSIFLMIFLLVHQHCAMVIAVRAIADKKYRPKKWVSSEKKYGRSKNIG